MKKTAVVSALAILGMVSFTAHATGDKTGLYLNGKAGISVMQLSGQKFSYQDNEYPDDNERYSGGRDSKAVFGGGIALGYDFSQQYDLPVRAEIEFSARGKSHSEYNLDQYSDDYTSESSDAKNQIQLNTVMLNAYYDFKNHTAFTPFVSAGLGYARVHQKTTLLTSSYSNRESESNSGTSDNLAWSLGAGVKYELNSDFSVDFSYRWLDAGKSEVSYKTDYNEEYKSKTSVRTHDVMLGLTYNF
ncbi:porin family protein [Salmonella enterica subsp. enterica]|uniref:Heat resistant agglutinin 1 n=1 Tax=Salmonella enterica TaxID=28901 RepID=A0A7D8ERV8_SALER|nr:porin family protein [Salmonella enterica subsp. enterica serovar Amherstiana]SUF97921.1 Heat resistant agglutinin 1 [Salmonella enterica]